MTTQEPQYTLSPEVEKEFDEKFKLLFNDKGAPEWNAGLDAFNRGEEVGKKRKAVIKSFLAEKLAQRDQKWIETMESLERPEGGVLDGAIEVIKYKVLSVEEKK
jgi:hypothetical protein